jgi:hypothetical protein
MSYRERNSLIKASKEGKFNKMMKRRADVVVSVATVALAKSQPIFKRKNSDCHHWSSFHAGTTPPHSKWTSNGSDGKKTIH